MKERSKTYIKDDWFLAFKNKELTDIKYVREFEQKLSEFTGIPYVYCLTNGTSALFLGSIALGVTNKSKCLIPSYSYNAVKVILEYIGASIDYIDIKEDTLCMNPTLLKKYLEHNRSTDYVFFINHLGYVGEDLFEVKNICDFYNVTLVEDSAQGLGEVYNKTPAGSVGKFGIYSFSGTKLIRCGEGGALITSSQHIRNKVEQLAAMGIGNYDMSPMSAIFLTEQLRDIDEITELRFRSYSKYISNGLNLVNFKTDYNVGYNACAVLLSKSNKLNLLVNLLEKSGYETRSKFYKPLVEDKHSAPVAYSVYERYIELPDSYNMTDDDFSKVSQLVKYIG